MIDSPSPTQQPPAIREPEKKVQEPEKKQVKLTPARKRMGETSGARFIKAILRPIFKVFYYLIRAIRSHKLLSLILILLMLAGAFLTSFLVTRNVPFTSSSRDNIQKSVQDNKQLSNDVKVWLLALRDDNASNLAAAEKSISQTGSTPPDTSLYLLEFSQARGRVTWTNVKVAGISTASDGVHDEFVEVDMTQASATAGGSSTNLVTIWHFTTVPQLNGQIVELDLVSAR